jgi:predicted transcriptional regulator
LTQVNETKFSPVAFNPKGYAVKRRKSDPKFAKAAGLTQAEVASRMGVSQPVVARIEASLGKKDHSPSLNTLRRYADACGMKLVIQMVAH